MAKLRPTLRQLHVFQTVASLHSFTRASEALHLSQPAVSIQVKQLEKTVGLPLFEQLGKKIHLTEAGETVFRCAQAISTQLNETAEALDQFKGIRRGHLKISVATTAGYFATRMLGAFSDRYPEIAIRLDVTNRASLLKQLETNRTDLVIMGEPPAGKDLLAKPFMNNPLEIVAAPSHPLTKSRGLKMQDLAGQTFVVREPGSGTRAAIERFFKAAGVEIQYAMEMSSNEAIKQALQAGMGLGIASRHTLELELDTGRLVLIDVDGFPIMRQWYLVQRTGKRLSPVAGLFQSFLLDQSQAFETA